METDTKTNTNRKQEKEYTKTSTNAEKKLTCVNVSVLLHVTLLVEPLSTVLAGIRSRVAAKRS